jgi:hypothetical protein
MFYEILGLTIGVMFIVLVIAFSYVDKNKPDDKYEWED